MNTQPPLGWGRGAVIPATETTGQGVGTRYNGCGDPLQWVWGPVTLGVGTLYNGCGDYHSGDDSAELGKVSLFHHLLGSGSSPVGYLFRDKSA